MSKVSVIVPVYKAEKYLNACIDSILNQSYNDLELILVDDGSPDNCPDICDTYALKDSRVRVVHQKNTGVAVARNSGLDIATGEYATFVDSDDCIDSTMYEKMMDVIEEYNCDLVMCDCVKEYKSESIIYTHNIRGGFYNEKNLQEEYYPHLIVMENIEYPATISNCLCLFRLREDCPRYEAGIRFSEDWIFGAQLMMQSRSFFYMKGQAYYHYRMNEQSATHTFVADKWRDYYKLHKRMKEDFLDIEVFDFSHQINLALLFLVYNAIGDLLVTKQLTTNKRITVIKSILKEPEVKKMFNDLNVFRLKIPMKLKLQTFCYKYCIGIGALCAYTGKK